MMRSIMIEAEPDETGMHKLVAVDPCEEFLTNCRFSTVYLQEMEAGGWRKLAHPTDANLIVYFREIN